MWFLTRMMHINQEKKKAKESTELVNYICIYQSSIIEYLRLSV